MSHYSFINPAFTEEDQDWGESGGGGLRRDIEGDEDH